MNYFMLSLSKTFPHLYSKKASLSLSKAISFSILILLDRLYLKTCMFGTFFICLFWKIKYFAKKIIKCITMTSHLGFKWQIPKVIVFTVMLILLLPHSQKICHWCPKLLYMCTFPEQMWNCFYLHTAKFAEGWTNNIKFCKNWLVGTIRIIYLYWKLRNLISFVDLKTVR